MLRDFDFTKLARAAGVLQQCPVWIDDTPALTLLEMRSKARRLKAENDVQLIVVDYLQLMSRSHRQRVLAVAPEEKVQMLGEYAGFTGESAEVPDPFGGDLADYRETYHRLEQMLGAVVGRLTRERAGGER